MRDYFAALAARTLRPELSVQPRHRVRWEDVPEPMVEVSTAAEEIIADGTRPRGADEGDRPRRSRHRTTADVNPAESATPRAKKDRTKGQRAGDRGDATAAMSSTPHPTVRALEPAVHVRFERVDTRAGDAAPVSRPMAEGRAAAAAGPRGIERAHPVPARRSARDRESAAAEPAIRIHIGRVDVRAVTAAAPDAPAVSRESKRALMSLDEYVQKRDRGVS